MTKIMPRPISQLTDDMGFVLLIGKSGVTSTPTRASVGRRSENGQIVDQNGDLFTENGEGAISFIDIPYDEETAITKSVLESSEAVDNLYISARGIVFALAPAVGPVNAALTLRMVLRDREIFEDGEDHKSEALRQVTGYISHDLTLTPPDEETIEHLRAIFTKFDTAVKEATRKTLSHLAMRPPATSRGRVDLVHRISKAREIIGDDFALALLKGFAERTNTPNARTGSIAERRLEHISTELSAASPFNAKSVLDEIAELSDLAA